MDKPASCRALVGWGDFYLGYFGVSVLTSLVFAVAKTNYGEDLLCEDCATL